MKSDLEQLIRRTLKVYSEKKGLELPAPFDFDLNVTKDPAHGDFSSNLAFKLAKPAHAAPDLIADELVLLIQNEGKLDYLDRVEVAGGGFLNFYLAKTSLAGILNEVHKAKEHYGSSDFGKGKKRIAVIPVVKAEAEPAKVEAAEPAPAS